MARQFRTLFGAIADGRARLRGGVTAGAPERPASAPGDAPWFDRVPAAVFALDGEGRLFAGNAPCARLFGAASTDEIRGTRFDRLLRDESARARLRTFVSGDAAALELHVSVRPAAGADSDCLLVFERRGPLITGVIIHADELVARLAALEHEAKLLREVVAAAPVGIATLGVDGRVGSVWNPAAEAMLGWPAAEVRAEPLPLLPVTLGIDAGGLTARQEVRRWRADGTPIELSVGTARLLGEDDAVVAILEDVTDRLVRESEGRRLGEIVRATPDIVLILDVDGTVLYLNPSAQARLERAEIGMPIDEVLGSGWNSCWRDDVVPVIAGGGSWTAELQLGGSDAITASVLVFGHRAHDGRLAFLSVLARDLTEQRSVENQLRQSQKLEALGQLTGGIAHDFNNLLTVVQANASMLRDRIDTADTDLLADIDAAAQRGRDLVRRLMVFSRNDALDLRPFRVAAFEDYVRTLRRILPETVAVHWLCTADDGIIEADPGALEQVLLNLATNARDAMPAGGTLTIAVTSPDAETVRISVSDTGTGIPAEVRDHIFEPFFTTKPAGLGTGLGLSMVYGIVRQLGGTLDVDSEPGLGTTFHMTFRRSSAACETPTAAARPVEIVRDAGRSILVVEDEAGIRRVLERLLKRAGHHVRAAGDGIEALALLHAHDDIDLVISDVVMPRLGGPELQERARAEGCATPFLFMSGYAERETRDRADLGDDTVVLSKPWTAAELHHAVQRVLYGRTNGRGHTSRERDDSS